MIVSYALILDQDHLSNSEHTLDFAHDTKRCLHLALVADLQPIYTSNLAMHLVLITLPVIDSFPFIPFIATLNTTGAI